MEIGNWRLRLPWLLWLVAVLLAVVGLGLALLNAPRTNPWENLFTLASVLAFATPGALIVVRQHGNRIGWIFLAIALLLGLMSLTGQYGVYAYHVAGRPLPPGALLAAWLQTWVGPPVFGLLSLFLLLYPDGRLPSRRWRPVLALVLLAWGAMLLHIIIANDPLVYYPLWGVQEILLVERNPTALGDFPGDYGWLWGVALLSFFLSVIAPLVRYRRAGSVVRQQLRWLMFLGVLLLAFLLGFIVDELLPALSISDVMGDSLFNGILFIGLPLAVSLAILRYRLYDIDIIIRRTLVYGLLTLLLALVYLASVLLLQGLFRRLTGQASPLALVVSTLAIAALFAPLRRRLQTAIDRRFFRRKYDAGRTLARFAESARDEVDLDELTQELLRVVDETMQPRSLSLWLRE